MTRFRSALLIVLCGPLLFPAAQAARAEANMVRNPDFSAPGEKGLPAHWTAWLPLLDTAACKIQSTARGLRIGGGEEPFAVGGVRQDLAGIHGGGAYAVDAVCDTEKLSTPQRSVMIRVTWTRAHEQLHPAGALVRGPQATGGELQFHDVLVAPKEADGVRLSLEVKWPRGGSVCWRHVGLCPTALPPPRKVKVGTVYLHPSQSTPERNRRLFIEQIDAAGRLGLDIVCLGEGITQVGTGLDMAQSAEPIPGPTVEQLAAAARRNRLWVVACLYERDGPRLFNTAVLLGRRGELAGKYRKTHLPREEWKQGVIPGHDYPVFETDFGRIAIQICYDWFFPEVGTMWRLKGAEIVFAPTWGTTFPDREGWVEGETVFRVRARDNGFYLVPSVYDGNSMVIDPLGRILASSNGHSGLFWHEIDLGEREPLDWVGQWRSTGPHDRMPETYGPISNPK
ncbi:MAG: carbon-nitrogen hydrolase family protein [Thermoguttaceae bacterium]|jgi:predicted amidohydrolase